MIPSEFLEFAEGLHHLDPVRSYPARAAKIVADLAHASSYSVEIDGANAKERRKVDSTPPPPLEARALSLPLRHGKHTLGTLHLYRADGSPKLQGADLRLVRWGARAFARGLAYTNRIDRVVSEGTRQVRDMRSRLEHAPLTRREKEVVALLVSGASTRAIAREIGLTVATIHTYLKRIYSKLDVHSRVELVARMVGTEGSAPPPPPPPDVVDPGTATA